GLGQQLELHPGGVLDVNTPRFGARIHPVPRNGGGNTWLAFYTAGAGAKRNILFTLNTDPTNPNSWSVEHLVSSPGALATVSDPYVATPPITTQNPLPRPVYLSYSGYNQRLGRTDLYLTRFDRQAITTPGAALTPDPLGRRFGFGQVGFARVDGDILVGNATR